MWEDGWSPRRHRTSSRRLFSAYYRPTVGGSLTGAERGGCFLASRRARVTIASCHLARYAQCAKNVYKPGESSWLLTVPCSLYRLVCSSRLK